MTEPTHVTKPSPIVTVIGEALIDLVQLDLPGDYRARPGGSPFNVAVGLTRLGHRTALMARLADNTFGRMLRTQAEAEGIDLTYAPAAAEPTTLAVVSMDSEGRASYDFYLDGTADWQWTDAETARTPQDTAVLHFGSVASWTPPAAEHIHSAVQRLRTDGTTLISYDPNVRPALLGDPEPGRHAVERSVGIAHLVKASREDVEWLYPDTSIERIAAHWLELGALLVVITDGPDGAHAFHTRAGGLSRPGRKVAVVDTVGAGDAFTAGLLGALLRHGLTTPQTLGTADPDVLAIAVDDAILVSALTCERLGADPPTVRSRPHLPAQAPLEATDLTFPDGTGLVDTGSPTPQPLRSVKS
ncbi:carbohydrate kinase family protein [Streptomyces barringtoniae]|uniref:carbohydrate kinase family protein n=1 Tax=Streptomyces barringtoniae TaxID=2892029 RepID=UPI001E458AAD|nr:carbohydrate kinase [Streptomyces barringtoniae]MCC5474492.1 carbohydrate kinase [Streptomyces barringtoniae]